MTVYDPETGKKITRKHRFTGIKIRAGSAVDDPAQEPAVAVLLMKRKDEKVAGTVEVGVSVSKEAQNLIRVEAAKEMSAGALTTAENGHTHLLDLSDRTGFTSWELIPGGDLGHSHPYVIDAEGKLTVGEAEGHSHSLDVEARKQKAGDGNTTTGANTMTPEEQAALDAEKKKSENLEKDVAAYKALAEMSDDQKAHFEALGKKSQDDAEAFLKLDADARAVEVSKAKDGKVVAYKAHDGRVFYEGESDPNLVAEVKRNDTLQVDLEKSRDASRVSTLKARVGAELETFPGEEDVRVDLLSAVDSIEDEAKRGKVTDALKAANGALKTGEVFKRRGTSGGEGGTDTPEGGNVEAQFEAGVKKYAEDHKVTAAKARIDFGQTERGVELRNAFDAEQPVNAGAAR